MFCCFFIDSVQVRSIHKTIKVVLMRNMQLICVHSSSPIEYGNCFPGLLTVVFLIKDELICLKTSECACWQQWLCNDAQIHFSALCPHGLWKWGYSGTVTGHYTGAVQICGQSEFDYSAAIPREFLGGFL